MDTLGLFWSGYEYVDIDFKKYGVIFVIKKADIINCLVPYPYYICLQGAYIISG